MPDGFMLLIWAADSSWMVSALGAGPLPKLPYNCHCDNTMLPACRKYHWIVGFRATCHLECQLPKGSGGTEGHTVGAWELAYLVTLQWAGGSLGPTWWVTPAANWGTSAQPSRG